MKEGKMDKVTVKGISFKLIGESIKTGSTLEFKAIDKDNKDFSISQVKGIKIISTFPALNTRVCDLQTARIASWARQYQNITFISVTTNSVDVISSWCAAHGIDNIQIVSDEKYKDFSTKTNLLVNKLNKLARGFIVLDENNKIIDMSYIAELSADPDYDMVERHLKG